MELPFGADRGHPGPQRPLRCRQTLSRTPRVGDRAACSFAQLLQAGGDQFVVEWGAVRRPQGLPADGLHARLPRL
jgi:hypothetical protein